MRRRTFLAKSVISLAGLSLAGRAVGEPTAKSQPKPSDIGAFYPTLQVPSETSMGIVWTWKNRQTCSGLVEYASKSDFSDKKTVYAVDPLPFRALSDQLLSVRIRGLKPNTRYFYRTVNIQNPGTGRQVVHVGKTYSFKTIGAKADSSFAVINDTHVNMKTFPELFKRIEALNPAVTLWNGDVCNYLTYYSYTYSLLKERYGTVPFAVERPFLYVPGNHDYRGNGARILKRVFLPRLSGERQARYSDLDRNFAVRVGDIAMVGLDTAEDKDDAHFHGETAFGPYLAFQTEWLADALEQPEIKNAPYLLVFTHIPLFHPEVLKNPDIRRRGWANWHTECSRMWSPLITRYGVQAVISAHTHVYRSFVPSKPYPWYQIIGGGPSLPEATVIDGKVAGNRLKNTAYHVGRQKILQEFTFTPRV